MRAIQSPDGSTWNVDVKLPSHSSALLMFQHSGGQSVAGDRYAWLNARVPAASDPRQSLSARDLLAGLTEDELARHFRRSIPV